MINKIADIKVSCFRGFIFFILFIQIINVFGQREIKIPLRKVEFADNKVHIEYDILNYKQTDLFRVWVVITNSSGRRINAQSLSGDIGDNIRGGINKRITWDLQNDNIILDENISFEVKTERIALAEEKKEATSHFNTGGLILSSTILPGAGLTRVHSGKPYWIIGLAGYGCIATSIIYNKKAVTSYNNYIDSYDIEESKKLFDNSLTEDNISKILAYSAIGIWVTDIIWVAVSAGKKNKTLALKNIKGFSIGSSYNPCFKKPMVSLSYRF
ncbi:MAG: hypothetical protein KAX05_13610 [Bacteroidales bacterium]|nr:hypothetical protein [Bacteroidales bacterium]